MSRCWLDRDEWVSGFVSIPWDKTGLEEPWDFQAFIRYFNARAATTGVRPLGAELDEAELRARYEKGAWRTWRTVREFAEAEVTLYSRD